MSKECGFMEKGTRENLTDNCLVERIKSKSCEDSLIELSERHAGLCFKIMKRYSKSFSINDISLNEKHAEKNLIIWRSAKSFNTEKKVKFSTWLANQIKYNCLNELNKKSKDRLVTLEEYMLDVLDERQEEKDTRIFEYTENILSQLKDPRIKKIFSLRYSKEEKKPSWASIASQMKISTQTAINLHNKGLSMLRKKMDSKKFLDNI
jgi:RNA polymerase sigma factor (sigma-70 family)